MISFRIHLLSFLFALAALAQPAVAKPHRIVFLGDSITYAGRYVELVEASLIGQHPGAQVEIINVGLPSETVSGLSEAGHAGGSFPRPDLHERLDRVLALTKPDTVFACYGMNCGIYFPLGEDRFAAYKKGMETLRSKVLALGANFIVMTPPVFDALPKKGELLPDGLTAYPKPFVGYDDVLSAYAAWLVSKRIDGWTVLDLHTTMKSALLEQRKTRPDFTYSKDRVHPDENGHRIFAKVVCDYLGLTSGTEDHVVLERVEQKQRAQKDAWLTAAGHKRPGMKKGGDLAAVEKQSAELVKAAQDYAIKEFGASIQPFPGKKSVWNGYDKYDFPVNGKNVSVVIPKTAAPGKPWVWEGEFFGHKPAPDIALLGKGFHVVYVGVQNLLGCPQAVSEWNAAYLYLVHLKGLNPKPALTGLSRGGLYALNWAIANPTKVSSIYLDAAVCDFKSWPGGKGKGKGGGGEWPRVFQVYGFPDEAAALAYKGNPIDNLPPLAKAGVPILSVYGDADDVVPWDENIKILAERYKALGGSVTLIPKLGVNHHPHGLADSTPIVEFIEKHAGNRN